MITLQTAEEIAARIEASTLSEVLVAELRQAYPGVHFTYCMDDDVHGNATPFVERPGFKLYLVGGNDHCPGLSCSPESASGLVLAEVVVEEDED
jgi:hypothetical protein